MGYLVLTRKKGERITLRVSPGTDADDLLAQLLLDSRADEWQSAKD